MRKNTPNSYRFAAALVSQVLLKTTTNPSCSRPSSCSVKPYPIRVISTPLASHMFTSMDTLTSRRMNYTLAKPL